MMKKAGFLASSLLLNSILQVDGFLFPPPAPKQPARLLHYSATTGLSLVRLDGSGPNCRLPAYPDSTRNSVIFSSDNKHPADLQYLANRGVVAARTVPQSLYSYNIQSSRPCYEFDGSTWSSLQEPVEDHCLTKSTYVDGVGWWIFGGRRVTNKKTKNQPGERKKFKNPDHHTKKKSKTPNHQTGNTSKNSVNQSGKNSKNPDNHSGKKSKNPVNQSGKKSKNPVNQSVKKSKNPVNQSGKKSTNPENQSGKKSKNPDHHSRKKSKNPNYQTGKKSKNHNNKPGKKSKNTTHQPGNKPKNPDQQSGNKPKNPDQQSGNKPRNHRSCETTGRRSEIYTKDGTWIEGPTPPGNFGPKFTISCLAQINTTHSLMTGFYRESDNSYYYYDYYYYDEPYTFTEEAWVYDWSKQQWSQVTADPKVEGRLDFGCAALKDRGVVVAGGYESEGFRYSNIAGELLDPMTKKWDLLPNTPVGVSPISPTLLSWEDTFIGLFSQERKVYQLAENGTWEALGGVYLDSPFGGSLIDQAVIVPADFAPSCN